MARPTLPPQPPLNPAADAYGAECLRRNDLPMPGVVRHADLAYGDDYWQKVDVYAPADGSLDGLPVLVFFHGGGWTHGYKEWCGHMVPPIVAAPAIFVSASYRLLPEADFPAPFDDARAVLDWVHAHIAVYGGDPGRIHVGGHSAGGQLASMLAVRPEWRSHLPVDVIKGCFCISTTFNRRVVNPLIAPDKVTNEAPDEVSPASSLAFAAQSTAPFLITWGGHDTERYERFSRAMVQALRAAGCPVASRRFDDCGHFDIHLDTGRADDPWTQAVVGCMTTGEWPQSGWEFRPGSNPA